MNYNTPLVNAIVIKPNAEPIVIPIISPEENTTDSDCIGCLEPFCIIGFALAYIFCV